MTRPARTRIIAHRGASGYLPEHTLAAKSLAYGLGADFLEQDVVATRDHELVVLHDLWLDHVSDVARVAPERRREDGHYYAIDFDLEELSRLTLHERKNPSADAKRFPDRFDYDLEGFRIVPLQEELQLISGLNATTERKVGVYPEIKAPGWHLDQGVDVANKLLIALETFDYSDKADQAFIQSFDAEALLRLRKEFETTLPLVQLLSVDDVMDLATDPIRIDAIAQYATGVGLPYPTLLNQNGGTNSLSPSNINNQLLDAGLLVHPYTFRKDDHPETMVPFDELLEFFIDELKVDALFCDHPDAAVRCRDRLADSAPVVP